MGYPSLRYCLPLIPVAVLQPTLAVAQVAAPDRFPDSLGAIGFSTTQIAAPSALADSIGEAVDDGDLKSAEHHLTKAIAFCWASQTEP